LLRVAASVAGACARSIAAVPCARAPRATRRRRGSGGAAHPAARGRGAQHAGGWHASARAARATRPQAAAPLRGGARRAPARQHAPRRAAVPRRPSRRCRAARGPPRGLRPFFARRQQCGLARCPPRRRPQRRASLSCRGAARGAHLAAPQARKAALRRSGRRARDGYLVFRRRPSGGAVTARRADGPPLSQHMATHYDPPICESLSACALRLSTQVGVGCPHWAARSPM
jgi:hypothetical protein